MRNCPMCQGSGQVSENLGKRFKSPEDVYARLRVAGFHDKEQEHFVALLVDTKMEITEIVTVSIGTLDGTNPHNRDIFRQAIRANAYGVILAHNHPSGNVEPSEQDINATAVILEAGSLLEIDVLDHLIISPRGFYSLRENDLKHGLVFR